MLFAGSAIHRQSYQIGVYRADYTVFEGGMC